MNLQDAWNYFSACKLYYRGYLLWKTDQMNIREYHLKLAKKDLEIARAFLNVERRRAKCKP